MKHDVEVRGSKIQAWVRVGDIDSFGIINDGSKRLRILTVNHEEDALKLADRFKEAAKRLEKGR